MQILISDELLNGTVTHQFEMNLSSNTISVQELIKLRVTKEIEAYHNRLPEYFNGLVAPVDAERTLNGFKLHPKQMIDIEKQVYIALDAFQKNGFFILLDHQQLESLDEMVTLQSTSKISFVKLTPLVGG
jgi:hypothetical protein